MARVTLAAVILCLAATMGQAEGAGPKPFADFSAKRVKPPAPGTRKRITIQIEPAAPEPVVTAAPALGGTGTSDTFAWFWNDISPAVSASGPGRLEPALIRLANPPQGQGVGAPRLQLLQQIANAHGADILRATIGTQVSPALVLAVIAVESSGRADAVSGAGAQGLMQLMPATAERFGVTDSFDPGQNIAGGVRFLDLLAEKFAADPILMLAGYNAGENAVGTHGGVPPFDETRAYVPKVLAAFQVAKGLCLTPPELITDGCVFQLAQR